MKNLNLIISRVLNGMNQLFSPSSLLTTLQVARWNLSHHLKRRQHNPNLHSPTNAPRITLPNNPHTLHNPHASHLHQLPHQLSTLRPLRSNHNHLPLRWNRPPNPPHKCTLAHSHTNIKLPPRIPHDGSILYALLSPLVLSRPFPSRNRLPDRPFRRIT